MRKPAFVVALSLVCTGVMAKDLNVLAIGNSFSVCVGRYLPSIVHVAPGHSLTLTSAHIGGCSLDRHWANIEAAEKNPEAKQYAVSVWTSVETNRVSNTKSSLNALIKQNDWDVITIQQVSAKSWDGETWQPYADNLIAYIREHAPRAEIVVQQTWSYNKKDGRIDPQNEKGWGFDQAGMFARIQSAYRTLAEAEKVRVIPVGLAVQNMRASGLADDPSDEDDNPLNDVGADVVGRGKGDNTHLNRRGEYLQACVWFYALFGDVAAPIDFIPATMPAEYARTLQACAQKAVTDYSQFGTTAP